MEERWEVRRWEVELKEVRAVEGGGRDEVEAEERLRNEVVVVVT